MSTKLGADPSDAVAGFGDTITFGGTKAIRDLINYEMDFEDSVNCSSGSYTAGAVTATIATVVLPTGSAAYGVANTVGAGLQGARAAAASGGNAYVRSGTWWSRLGQVSGYTGWFVGLSFDATIV